jgi:hypothetical protein
MRSGLVVGLILAGAGAAHADPGKLDLALAAYESLELERAGALVAEVLAEDPAPPERARALVLRALLAYQSSAPDQGLADLSAALDADPGVELPRFAPPSVREAFDHARAERATAPPPPPQPPRAPPPSTVHAEPHRAPALRLTVRRSPRPLVRRAWFWSGAGTGLAVLVSGFGYTWALLTRSAIESQPHERPDLTSLNTRFDTARFMAIAGAVTGAGLAALTALLVYLDSED